MDKKTVFAVFVFAASQLLIFLKNSNTIVHVMNGIHRAPAQQQGKYELRAHHESARM